MHHRSIRFMFAVVLIMAVARAFGSGTAGNAALFDEPLATQPVVIALDADTAAWCVEGPNVPLVLAAAAEAELLDAGDGRWLWLLEATERDLDPDEAQRLGSLFAALQDRWPKWDQACLTGHAAFAAGG